MVNAKKKTKEGGSGPCGKGCKLCEFMVNTNEVTDKRGAIRNIIGSLDCRMVGAIYGIWCKKCEKIIYVGKTQNRVMDRFIGHRADLKRRGQYQASVPSQAGGTCIWKHGCDGH